MAYILLRRQWRSTRAMYFTMIAELLGTVAVLVLFGISQPDLYRTKLWRAGHELGFNSSPNVILYAYANYEPLPKLPFIWSQTYVPTRLCLPRPTRRLTMHVESPTSMSPYPFLAYSSSSRSLSPLLCTSGSRLSRWLSTSHS